MKSKGFTLVEVLVALLLFSIIMLVSVSAFTFALDLQRRAFNLQQAEENTNFILESIAKELRVSTITAPLIDTCPVAALVILHPDNGAIAYSYDPINFNVHRVVGGVVGTDTIMNSNTIQFTRFDMCISGAQNDTRQARVMIRASLKTTNTNRQATVDFQTSLSLRVLNP